MFHEWKKMVESHMKRGDEFAELTPATRAGYRQLQGASAETGQLGPKMHELIALAVAVTTRSEGCIGNHTRKAIEHGATRQEIAEALGIAVAMNAGAALAYSQRALDAHAEFSGDAT